jgi:capsule polysaccharide export protein KpsE/RkpR
MQKKVAVESNLTGIAKALENKGYTVVSPKSGADVIAAVVMGMDNNLMNIQNTVTKAPVIVAAGLTPEEVVSRIESLKLKYLKSEEVFSCPTRSNH